MRAMGAHETLELHELLSFKNVCLTKNAAMQGLVTDSQLKSLIQQDIQKTQQHIRDLQNLLS
jgi:similar to spore coat protein